MPTIHYVNPVAELADAQTGVAQARSDGTFAEQLVLLAAQGYGDSQAANFALAMARSQIGSQRQREEFWLSQVKDDKDSLKKAWELVKD